MELESHSGSGNVARTDLNLLDPRVLSGRRSAMKAAFVVDLGLRKAVKVGGEEVGCRKPSRCREENIKRVRGFRGGGGRQGKGEEACLMFRGNVLAPHMIWYMV